MVHHKKTPFAVLQNTLSQSTSSRSTKGGVLDFCPGICTELECYNLRALSKTIFYVIKFNVLIGCRIVLANPKYNCMPYPSVPKMITAFLRPSSAAGTRIAELSGDAGLFKRSRHQTWLPLVPTRISRWILRSSTFKKEHIDASILYLALGESEHG